MQNFIDIALVILQIFKVIKPTTSPMKVHAKQA